MKKKKILTVGIILLFIGMSIIPSTAQDIKKSSLSTSSGNWLYVGGSGPGNFTKIQDAVDNASDGDTVYVYSGIYNDYYPSGQQSRCVLIHKSLNLTGENKYTTIINVTGVGDVIRVMAVGVTISGFTIQNSGGEPFYGGINLVDGRYSNIDIHNNIITKNRRGILIDGNYQVNIHNNTIINNGLGIGCDFPTACIIRENEISNNTYGLNCVFGDSSSRVCYNQIKDNDVGFSADISAIPVVSNNFIGNKAHVGFTKGVYLSSVYLLPTKRLIFFNNYWDDWDKITPKPLKGTITIWIHFFFGGTWGDIPIATFPYILFDLLPAKEPHVIPVMN